MAETRDNGQDFVFRFRIPRHRRAMSLELDEFYRAELFELAKMVQFHFRGEPVDVDSFAFRNAPEKVIALLPDAEPAPEPEVKAAPRRRAAAVRESADL